ncbi:putative heme-binding domain-containing protein [Haloferula luteola]|uniref:Putative heme-binding domain-containing protein n=1 Tax=Haloferula luteola TaxID=595692 RepID=A0A840UZZ0_9BACT|nr:family 16 glycoside hydrolase [Haloferula luteola]MBB5351332.1 putative heme-binding domain-containing protein [Haloferula luteola]
MHRIIGMLGALSLGIITAHAEDSSPWQDLFNGKNLDGWSGDPRLWSVEDGILTGRTDDGERKLTVNSYLILDVDVPADFELEFKARVTGENSGVQYRSWKVKDVPFGVGGLQCDLHPQPEYLGMFYDERGTGITVKHGEKVTVGQGVETLPASTKPPTQLGEWNTYRVQAVGRHYRHQINGQTVAELIDADDSQRPLDGIIGLQLHVGGPMKAEYKDFRIRPLAAWPGQASTMVPVPEMPGTQLLEGFHLEKVYDIPAESGSWVTMTRDDQGNFYCGSQYGGIWKVTLDKDGKVTATNLNIPLESTQGVLWNDGCLWISSTESPDGRNGVWRVDLRQGTPAEPELVKPVPRGGEHGLHTLRRSPDGQFIYLVSGNHCPLPEFDRSLVPEVWAEDQLLPRRPDANGHAANVMAPGGWIARFRPDGSDWTLVAIGLRNSYGLDFNADGQLYTYDADMEWDFGMPWYRPTRICEVVPGAEFGWRNGTGKWPEAYEDSLPAALNIGPGSPTALLSGRGAKFPAAYQRALFAFDWTYATIRAIHTDPGQPVRGEEFLAGNGLPLTDGVVGTDGALYFLSGGRRAASALWKISYTGKESTAPIAPAPAIEEPTFTLDEAWQKLGSTDRTDRFLARTRLELYPPSSWSDRLKGEKNPWRVIGGAIALARTDQNDSVQVATDALVTLDFSALDSHARINWLRAVGLIIARHGALPPAQREQVLGCANSSFPSGDREVDHELVRLLCAIQAPGIVSRTLDWADQIGAQPPPDWLELAKRNAQYGADIEGMIAKFPSADRIQALYCLRAVPGPWSGPERERVFAWFQDLLSMQGGRSYAGFIKDLRQQMLDSCTPEEQERYRDAGKGNSNPFANLPPVQGPGHSWTVDEIVALANEGLDGRDAHAGENMFKASLCSACHRFDGEGGAAGPDLSAVGGRFSIRDLAEAIVDPNKLVSDQYAWETLVLHDGSRMNVRVIEETEESLTVATNAFEPSEQSHVFTSDLHQREHSAISPMPPGLINRLNPEELKDLLAFLLRKSA